MNKTEFVIVGAGPGGYAAAFHAADRGRKVVLVEERERLGGVCLNAGCIPSKALLQVAHLIAEAKGSQHRGVVFGHPKIDLDQMRAWKESILDKLGQGVRALAQARGVEVVQGRGRFEDSQTLVVETPHGEKTIHFEKAVIATGSKAARTPAFDLGSERVMTSTEALALEEIPKELLVIGAGYIGMELGTVYAALGSEVVLVEALDSILPGIDSDLVRPVMRAAERAFREVRLGTRVAAMEVHGKKIKAVLESGGHKKEELYDRVLISVGRVPNCEGLGLEKTRVERDEKGFIKVDSKQRTSDPFLYAIGDAVGGPMLAHKASKEARVAVDAMTGDTSDRKDAVIPSVVFTDPEVAWCGLTENEARSKNIPVEVARFPWSASGRAQTLDRPEGLTKLVIEPGTEKILGMGIVGAGAGELIGEGVLAIGMGATARHLADCVHPHPTLSETLMECAQVFYGTAAHALGRKKGQTLTNRKSVV